MSDANHIASIETLEALYGEPNPNAIRKELDYISPEYAAFIERAPFAAMATAGPDGLDCTPRGDPPGFCVIEDSRTVLMPDRRGNNRLDSLRNLVVDPRIALLFLVPGIGETIRINGRAEIRTDPHLLERFIVRDRLPRSVIRITVERVYFQCQKAIARSKLWDSSTQLKSGDLPTAGQMLRHAQPSFDAEQYDSDYPERMKKTIY